MVLALHVRLTVHVGLGIHMRPVMRVVLPLRLGGASMVVMMVAVETGRHAERHRARDNGVGSHQHHGPSKTGYLICLAPPQPRPTGSHDDVELK